jgi:hypothetical protein
MKKINILITCFLTVTFSGLAQDYYCLIDTVKTYTENPPGPIRYSNDYNVRHFYSNQKIKQNVRFIKDITSNEYKVFSAQSYVYNDNKNILFIEETRPAYEGYYSIAVHFYIDNVLLLIEKRIYPEEAVEFDPHTLQRFSYQNNQLVNDTLYESNNLEEAWRYVKTFSYKYTQNRLTEKIEERWDSTSNEWVNHIKENFSYQGDLIAEVITSWIISGNWNEGTKSIYYYNQRDQIDSITHFENRGTMGWQQNGVTIYRYDEKNILVDKATFSDWSPEGYRWLRGEEYVCFATAEVFSVPNLKSEVSIQVYPNPITSGQLLKIETTISEPFVIFNQLGQEIQRGELQKGLNTIEMNQTPPGIYFFKTSNFSHKMIVVGP